MYQQSSKSDYQDVIEGIQSKTLVHGDKTLMAEFKLKEGALLAKHNHPHEQTGYLVRGHIELTVGDVTHQVKAGDSWCIGADVEHHATAIEDSVAIEVFSPVREDYLPQQVVKTYNQVGPRMAVRRRISFKERLAGAGIGLVICFAAMPIAIVATILLMPFWSWLEASIAIEAVGHSGPAEWCYLFIYLLMVTTAGFIWSAHRRSTAS